MLNVMLAFVPQDIKAISSTGFDAYIINDSNYIAFYLLIFVPRHNWRVRSWGTVQRILNSISKSLTRSILNELGACGSASACFKDN